MHDIYENAHVTMDDIYLKKCKKRDYCRTSPWAVEHVVDIARTYATNLHHLEVVRRLIAPADDMRTEERGADDEACRRVRMPDLRLHELLLELKRLLAMRLTWTPLQSA